MCPHGTESPLGRSLDWALVSATPSDSSSDLYWPFHTMAFQERRRIEIREQERRMLDRFRGHPHLFSLHCLIWSHLGDFEHADMCRDCVADKVCIVKLDDGNEERLPINVLRNILLYVGFASSH